MPWIAEGTRDELLAEVAERRLVRYQHSQASFAALQWLLGKRPPEEGLALGLVSASILSMNDEVRALAKDFDSHYAVVSPSTWMLPSVTGPGSKPTFVKLEAGDDSRVVCGKLIAALEKSVAGLRVEQGLHSERRLATAQARLAVVQGWPHVRAEAAVARSAVINALSRLVTSTAGLDTLVNEAEQPISQYMAAVRFLQQNPKLLRSWPGEHPLGLIVRGDGPGMSVVNDTDPLDYPSEARDYLELPTHGEFGGSMYFYSYENDRVVVVAVSHDKVVRHGTLEEFVCQGVETLLGDPASGA